MRKALRILLTGGGSGGHILPNLAIADALRRFGNPVEILYIGSRSPLDARLVREAGIPFRAVFTGKLRRYFSLRNWVDPFWVLLGFFQSLWILIRFRPHAVFCKGGFVSVPVALAAFLLRRPVILHESDSVMGLSNRLIARLATKVCVAFPGVSPDPSREVLTGNPVRLSIQDGDPEKGYRLTGFRKERPVLLVWGGSQGAEEINELLRDALPRLTGVFQVVHVTGEGKRGAGADNEGSAVSRDGDPSYRAFEYLGAELPDVYAITDLAVSRAGANSLYELALMRKPMVLVPLRSAAHDHQTRNAAYFEQKGGAVTLGSAPLYEVLTALWYNPPKLEAMRRSLGELARPDAARDLAELIVNTAVSRHPRIPSNQIPS